MVDISIYRLPDILTISRLGKTSLYTEIKKGTFPAPISLTEGGRAVGWLRSDVDVWLESRVKRANAATQLDAAVGNDHCIVRATVSVHDAAVGRDTATVTRTRAASAKMGQAS